MKQKAMPAGRRGDAQLTITIIVVVLFVVGAYFAYKYFIPQLQKVVPEAGPSISAQPIVNLPVIIEPKLGAKYVSPQVVRGTVPPGWMFEGVFPVKLTDSQRKIIVEAQAKEEVPGSWQSNATSYFTVTLTFSTTAKTGFLILMNDNPSGDPANAKSYEVPVNF